MSHLFWYFSLQLLLSFSSMRAGLLCFIHNLARTWKRAWDSGTSTRTCWVNEWMNQTHTEVLGGQLSACIWIFEENFRSLAQIVQSSCTSWTQLFLMSPHHIDQNQEIKLRDMLLTKGQNSLGWTRVCTNALLLIQDPTWHLVIMSPGSPPIWVTSSVYLPQPWHFEEYRSVIL